MQTVYGIYMCIISCACIVFAFVLECDLDAVCMCVQYLYLFVEQEHFVLDGEGIHQGRGFISAWLLLHACQVIVSVVHLLWHDDENLWYNFSPWIIYLFLPSSFSSCPKPLGVCVLLCGGAVASGNRHTDMYGFAMLFVGIQLLTNRNM